MSDLSANICDEPKIFQVDGNISLSDIELDNSPITVRISDRNESQPGIKTRRNRELITIKRNNKLVDAVNLPVIVMLNPRSLYNKQSEFRTLIEQSETDVCFISETWDRSHNNGALISDLLEIEGFKWVQNVVQRKRKGGKPALLINTKNYHITDLCPDLITVPTDVEVAWSLITPKRRCSNRIKHIVLASVYYSSKFTKKNMLIDHLSETYHILCSKYGSDLKFVFGGDFNRLNLKPILSLANDLKQVVTVPTRQNPDAILDKLITNMSALYQSPYTLPPLDNDEDQTGKPSDHLIVCMRPLSSTLPAKDKVYKIIKYRPFPDSAIRTMGQWIQSQKWEHIYRESDPNAKVIMFEKILVDKINELFPEKVLKVNENDKPWIDSKLLKIDRLRKREYSKRKKSEKWLKLNKLFHERAQVLKESYYKDRVEDLKNSNVSQWFSKVKRMSEIDPTKEDRVEVHDLMHLPSSDQGEEIANRFAEISNQYAPLKSDDIPVLDMESSKPHPLFEPYQVHEKIQKMKKKSATVPNDIPWKIISEFSVELASPLCNIFNSCTLDGVWPEDWKKEFVTPVPKVFPPQSIDDLRKISMTKNLSKLYEALLADTILEDISPQKDPSQFGNERGLSTTHFLVKMMNKILTILDSNNQKEKYAVVAQLVDWSKAFDRQDPKLGVNAFIDID